MPIWSVLVTRTQEAENLAEQHVEYLFDEVESTTSIVAEEDPIDIDNESVSDEEDVWIDEDRMWVPLVEIVARLKEDAEEHPPPIPGQLDIFGGIAGEEERA